MTKLVIFDKDGTLTTPKSREQFVQHPEDQKLLPGVAEGIAAMAADEWAMAIASNQGGVAAGYKSLEDAIAEMRYCLKLLPDIEYAYFCPSSDRKWWQRIFKSLGYGLSQCFRVDADEQIWRFAEWAFDEDAVLAGCKNLDFRKPGSLMLFAAQAQSQNSPTGKFRGYPFQTLFIGDRPEDEQSAANAGVAFRWADEWRAQYI